MKCLILLKPNDLKKTLRIGAKLNQVFARTNTIEKTCALDKQVSSKNNSQRPKSISINCDIVNIPPWVQYLRLTFIRKFIPAP